MPRTFALGLIAAVAVAGASTAQEEPYLLEPPGPALLRELLTPPAAEDTATVGRNIVTTGTSQSLVRRPAGAAPAAQTGGGTRPAAAVPKPTRVARARAAGAMTDAMRPCKPYEDLSVSIGVFFDVNSAVLKPRHEKFIGDIAEMLHADEEMQLVISGHTDVSGGDAINVPLSVNRALAVANRLVARYGVDASRLQAVGRSSTQLCYPDRPRHPLNRRVTVARK
jgi:outer membrane protein OmpA-like peptidoglycan-associated protein